MPILNVRITQYADNIEHMPVLDFSFTINDSRQKIKVTEKNKCESFANLINLLYKFYPNKTFKISKPMRVDFFLDNEPIGSYLPKRYKKDLNNKFKSNFQFKVRESDYILIEYIENHKRNKKKEECLEVSAKESYLSLRNLLNSKDFKEQKLPKFWNPIISTPMYS